MPTGPNRLRAFSIIELLIVITIIIALAAISIPTLRSTNTASQLTRCSQHLADQMQLASQLARTRNHSTELRLYELPDPLAPTHPVFRGYQIFLVNDTETYEPLSKMYYLPSGFVMNPLSRYSTLLTALPATAGGTALPGIGTQYQYIAFQFRPDGSLSLSDQTTPSGGWFVTIQPQQEPDDPKMPGLKRNFATIQVDPMNGIVRVLRPQ